MINADILNNNLQKAVRDKLPKGANIANVIKDILFLGKEAVYRRLRGEVQFTLHEAAQIAAHFGLSLDSIVKTVSSENLIFELKPQRYYNMRDIDYKMLYEYRDTLRFAKTESYSEQVFTSNIFPQFPSHQYYYLGKYSSFRWIYLNQDIGEIKPLHDLDFPDALFKVNKEIIEETMNIQNTCYIWDSTVFRSIVKEIKYFYSIRLINNEDIFQLKNELLKMISFMEEVATKGRYENGNKVALYISNVNSDTSYFYLKTDHLDISMLGAFALNHIVSLEPQTLLKIKERVQSLKRVSTLISESGEMQRIKFFNEQREIVETLCATTTLNNIV